MLGTRCAPVLRVCSRKKNKSGPAWCAGTVAFVPAAACCHARLPQARLRVQAQGLACPVGVRAAPPCAFEVRLSVLIACGLAWFLNLCSCWLAFCVLGVVGRRCSLRRVRCVGVLSLGCCWSCATSLGSGVSLCGVLGRSLHCAHTRDLASALRAFLGERLVPFRAWSACAGGAATLALGRRPRAKRSAFYAFGLAAVLRSTW